MNGKLITKEILIVFIIVTLIGLSTSGFGAAADKKQPTVRLNTPMSAGAESDSADSRQLKLDIIFVLDNSGSMIKNDPKFITRKVVSNFLNSLQKEFRLGMVIFDKDARLVEPLTEITGPKTRAKFFSGLDNINYKGQFTNSPAGIERAIYELKKHGRNAAEKVIILLTDGIVDTGDKNRDMEEEQWLKEDLTRESKKAGIRIFGIAFTDKADFRLMQILALKTNGEYFRAYSAEDIPGVFENIIAIITTPQMKDTSQSLKPSEPITAKVPKESQRTAPPNKKEPVKKKTALLPLILSVIAFLMGVIVLITIYKKKAEVRVIPDGYRDRPQSPLPPDHPVFKAELIDAENIVSKDSLSLALNKESISIGRDSSNDIVIPEESVSSLHATIEYKNGHFYLEDHRSTNGTSLNGKEIKENEPVRLKSGDKIHFAIFEFRFLLHDQAPFGETIMLSKDQLSS